MGKWKERRLDEIASKITDGSHNPPKKVEVGYPMYSGRNLVDGKLDFSNPSRFVDELGFQKENKRTNVQPGDIFLSIVGSIGLTAIVPDDFEPFVIQRSIALIRTEQNSEFIRYYFESPIFQNYLEKEAKGAAQKGVYLTTLRGTKIPLPPLPEQQRIVAKLDGLFAKIDQAIGLLEENIAHTQALMGSVLDEEFGRLEANYNSKPLAEIVTVINGRAYKKTEMLDSGKYPILRVGNFFSNRGWYYSDLELNDDKYCEKGDLLYAWSASFGPKIWDGEKSIYHYHIWKLVPLKNEVSRKYLYYLLERDTEKIKEEGGRGVGMIHITKGGIEKRMMVLPPIEIQNKVVQTIENFYDLHDKLLKSETQKLNHLKALKSSLLDQAFKGEL